MILIKQHNAHHVARLYLHLYCMAVDRLFDGKQLFPYLDYDLETRVIRGVVCVYIDLHTAEARQLADQLTRLKVPLDDESRTMAIVQIAADKKQFFGIVGEDKPDFDALNKELSELDARPWQGIDDFDLVIPQENQLENGTFYPLADKGEIATREVNVALSLDKSFADAHGELLPLFWYFARLMSASIGRQLYAEAGFFGARSSRKPSGRATTFVRHYRAVSEVALLVNDIRDIIEDVVIDLNDAKAFKRMIAELALARHSNPEGILPDPLYVLDRTGVVIGAEGWRKVATDENCNQILSHMKVTVSSGRSRASGKIA